MVGPVTPPELLVQMLTAVTTSGAAPPPVGGSAVNGTPAAVPMMAMHRRYAPDHLDKRRSWTP